MSSGYTAIMDVNRPNANPRHSEGGHLNSRRQDNPRMDSTGKQSLSLSSSRDIQTVRHSQSRSWPPPVPYGGPAGINNFFASSCPQGPPFTGPSQWAWGQVSSYGPGLYPGNVPYQAPYFDPFAYPRSNIPYLGPGFGSAVVPHQYPPLGQDPYHQNAYRPPFGPIVPWQWPYGDNFGPPPLPVTHNASQRALPAPRQDTSPHQTQITAPATVSPTKRQPYSAPRQDTSPQQTLNTDPAIKSPSRRQPHSAPRQDTSPQQTLNTDPAIKSPSRRQPHSATIQDPSSQQTLNTDPPIKSPSRRHSHSATKQDPSSQQTLNTDPPIKSPSRRQPHSATKQDPSSQQTLKTAINTPIRRKPDSDACEERSNQPRKRTHTVCTQTVEDQECNTVAKKVTLEVSKRPAPNDLDAQFIFSGRRRSAYNIADFKKVQRAADDKGKAATREAVKTNRGDTDDNVKSMISSKCKSKVKVTTRQRDLGQKMKPDKSRNYSERQKSFTAAKEVRKRLTGTDRELFSLLNDSFSERDMKKMSVLDCDYRYLTRARKAEIEKRARNEQAEKENFFKKNGKLNDCNRSDGKRVVEKQNVSNYYGAKSDSLKKYEMYMSKHRDMEKPQLSSGGSDSDTDQETVNSGIKTPKTHPPLVLKGNTGNGFFNQAASKGQEHNNGNLSIVSPAKTAHSNPVISVTCQKPVERKRGDELRGQQTGVPTVSGNIQPINETAKMPSKYVQREAHNKDKVIDRAREQTTEKRTRTENLICGSNDFQEALQELRLTNKIIPTIENTESVAVQSDGESTDTAPNEEPLYISPESVVSADAINLDPNLMKTKVSHQTDQNRKKCSVRDSPDERIDEPQSAQQSPKGEDLADPVFRNTCESDAPEIYNKTLLEFEHAYSKKQPSIFTGKDAAYDRKTRDHHQGSTCEASAWLVPQEDGSGMSQQLCGLNNRLLTSARKVNSTEKCQSSNDNGVEYVPKKRQEHEIRSCGLSGQTPSEATATLNQLPYRFVTQLISDPNGKVGDIVNERSSLEENSEKKSKSGSCPTKITKPHPVIETQNAAAEPAENIDDLWNALKDDLGLESVSQPQTPDQGVCNVGT